MQMSISEHGNFLQIVGSLDCSVSINSCSEKLKCQQLRLIAVGGTVRKTTEAYATARIYHRPIIKLEKLLS